MLQSYAAITIMRTMHAALNKCFVWHSMGQLTRGIVLGGLTGAIAMEMSTLAYVGLKPAVSRCLKMYRGEPLHKKKKKAEGEESKTYVVYDNTTVGPPAMGMVVSRATAKRKKQKDLWVRIARLVVLVAVAYVMVTYLIK